MNNNNNNNYDNNSFSIKNIDNSQTIAPTIEHTPRVTDIFRRRTLTLVGFGRKVGRKAREVRLLLLLLFVCWLVACLTSQQHASVSQGRICSDNFTCCHTEIEVADPTFYLTQSQYTDTGPTSPSADPIMPVAWQGSHWSANF